MEKTRAQKSHATVPFTEVLIGTFSLAWAADDFKICRFIQEFDIQVKFFFINLHLIFKPAVVRYPKSSKRHYFTFLGSYSSLPPMHPSDILTKFDIQISKVFKF